MSKLHRVMVNGETFAARSGQILLDAALSNGVDLPHDCRAGRCGACMTRVVSGITMGGQSSQRGTVHACQAMVFSDLALEVEPQPPVVRVKGRVAHVEEIAEDIVEIAIDPASPLDILAGQFCRFRFRGFPDRPFSPTAPMAHVAKPGYIHLHVKRVRGGQVTPQLGTGIKAGHAVVVEGPRGHAYLRPGQTSRLVLIGSGTGFAPVWAIAVAALAENPHREILLLAASRKASAFYMCPALEIAATYPRVTAIPCIEELGRRHGAILAGPTIENVPALLPTDIVFAAGGPGLVNAVSELAAGVGAEFYADPFEAGEPRGTPWLERARAWIAVG